MRTTLGIVAGIIAALIVQSALGYLSAALFPMPAVNLYDSQQVAESFAARPTGALLISLLGYFAGALAGGYVARLIADKPWTVWVPAGLLALMGLIIAVTYPEPAWAQFGAFLAALLGGMAARHLPARSRVATAAPDA